MPKSDGPAGRVMRGDEALALGASAAGVRVVSGYPGSPSTGVLDALLRLLPADASLVEWAPNEKVAMEIAFGASLGGTRSLVVLKSVGMNIALDALATVSLSGSHAGLVVVLGDDPGGWGSQNEQDTRWVARVAEVPVLEPIRVRDAPSLMVQAFAWSESIGTPVIVRITRAMALREEEIEQPWMLPPSRAGFVRKRNRWIVLPAYVVNRHWNLHRRLVRYQAELETSPYDVTRGDALLGVVAAGITYSKYDDAVKSISLASQYATLGLASVWPLPEKSLAEWLRGRRRVLVLEEGGPFAEEQIRALAQRHGLETEILGRQDRAVPGEGELTASEIIDALEKLDPDLCAERIEEPGRSMPSRVPLCDDCPYLPVMQSLIETMERHGGRENHIVIGETGCMVRANLEPMALFDVKYGLGSGLGLAMGLASANTGKHIVAIVGDSSFFHSDINAMPHLAQKQTPMTVIVLDNRTTALTGGQAHPGSDLDERGDARDAADLVRVIRGSGTEARPVDVQLCNWDDRPAIDDALQKGLSKDALRVLVVRGPCPRYA